MKLENLFIRAASLSIPQLAGQAKDYLNSHPGGAAILLHNTGTTALHTSFDFSAFTNMPTDVVVPGGATHLFRLPPGITKLGHAFYVGSTPNHGGTGTKRDADTKVEFTMNGWSNHAYFDVDVERGVSLPVRATDLWAHSYAGCAVDKVKTCPHAWKHFHTDGRLDQCKNPQTREAIDYFRQGCPDWYVQSNDKMTKVKPYSKSSGNVLLVAAGPNAAQGLEELRKQAKSVLAP